MPAADPFGLSASGIPPELQAEYRGLTRQQAIQEALLQQSLQPTGGVIDAGRFKVARSPWEGLAKVAQAYMARQGLADGDKRMADLGGRYQSMTADEVRRYQQMKSGTPGTSETIIDEQADGGVGAPATINAPGVAGDPRAAITQAMLSRNPMLQKLGAMDYAQMVKPPVKTDLGDRWKVEYGDGRVAYEAKAATPDAVARQAGENARFAGVSGNTAATVAGANLRHETASGSAKLGSNTTLATHASPSGSALTAAATARRGQDISANTAAAAQTQAVNPEIQGRLAEWKAAGTERGKTAAEAQAALPGAIATAKQGVELIDQMIGDLNVDDKGKLISGGAKKPHPGFSVGVGASVQPGLQYVPGTDKAGFYALKDQVMGGAFLEAFKTLKGSGQITEIEGTKATSAITRMSTAQNEVEFVKAAREFQDVIRAGAGRADSAARRGAGAPAAATGAPRVVDW